ncbi:GntR family transcriptional regulator [Bacillus swezeyi]|uniref:GntR family transcriptional regulator n=1 Tax=Bacillus swezeyi TaxID=1925020 RepID=A0A5M8RY58_9BACI|nr:GntR family transcriptional regulator [Bacillus swezeyi]KAA6452779.1 GntR family transcriptional regulator [Bacillus swezeyi]
MKKTREQAAYSKIKNKIIEGKYKEGLRLTESRLEKELKMSRTPIRNALSRLTSEGFLKHQSHRGITVAKTKSSFEDIIEFLEIRLLFFKLSVEKAAKNNKRFDIDNIRKCLRELPAALEKDDADKFHHTLWELHELLLSPAENKTLMQVMKDIQEKKLLGGAVEFSYMKRKPYESELLGLMTDCLMQLENKGYEKAVETFEQIHKEIILGLL